MNKIETYEEAARILLDIYKADPSCRDKDYREVLIDNGYEMMAIEKLARRNTSSQK